MPKERHFHHDSGLTLAPLQLDASVMIKPFINYFNLKVSHWEPLMDPWEFAVHVSTATFPEQLEDCSLLTRLSTRRSLALFRPAFSRSTSPRKNVSSSTSPRPSSNLP